MGKKVVDEQALITAALDEFTAHNYESASVNTIIDRAGISKGSFYYRFSDKYGLYLFLIRTGIDLKWDYIKNNQKSNVSEKADIFEWLIEQARAGVEFAIKNPKYYQLGRMFSREKGSQVSKRILKDIGDADTGGYELLLKQMYESEYFDRKYDSGFIGRIIPFLLKSFDEAFPAAEMENPEEVLRYFEEYVEFIKSGLLRT
ncbi:MAG: TetR/AcrR family transcriptional regulator [Spirochaetales bacterium]|nr:TetR/AcrR family transcriptional regulator [Spirochaetales bacterium]